MVSDGLVTTAVCTLVTKPRDGGTNLLRGLTRTKAGCFCDTEYQVERMFQNLNLYVQAIPLASMIWI